MKSVSALIAICFSAVCILASDEWVDLFDGKTLNGWEVHSGTAKYSVEDGAIVGTTVEGSPNSFLCTQKEYGDFVLQFEVKVDPSLNSGVQIRSQIAPRELEFRFPGNDGQPQKRVLPADRVYGYQVEISHAEQGTSGSVYDEARRAGWLYNTQQDPEASKAFKDNEWNKYRIECKGDSINTWINAIACSKFRDSMTAKGVIGLQVHSIAKGTGPFEVRWRNLRIKELN
jgi:hypothetical protein